MILSWVDREMTSSGDKLLGNKVEVSVYICERRLSVRHVECPMCSCVVRMHSSETWAKTF